MDEPEQRAWGWAFRRAIGLLLVPFGIVLVVTLTHQTAHAQDLGDGRAVSALASHCEKTTSELYAQGEAAWSAGDSVRAEALLRCAAKRQPDNTDILLYLGLAQAAQQKWAAAEATLTRGLSLAPDYTGIRLALARVHYWQEAYDRAASVLAPSLDEPEPRPKALALAGRIALANGQPERALELLEQAMQRRPEDAELRVALGDAALAAGNRQAARRSYREASRLASDDETAQQRLADMHRRPWGIGGFLAYSDLSDDRDDWIRSGLVVNRMLSEATTLSLTFAVEDRGFARDETLDLRLDHQQNDAFGGFIEATVSPDADFRANGELEGGLRRRLRSGGDGVLGESWLVADARHLAFDGKNVAIVEPGLRQYLFDGQLVLESRYIGVWDEEGGFLDGVNGRADVIVSDRLRLFAGAAVSPETERDAPSSDFRTVDMISAFGGIEWDVRSYLTLDVSYAYHDREDSYERRTFAVGLSGQF